MTTLGKLKPAVNAALYARIRAFWFDGLPSDAPAPPPELLQRWMGGSSADDKAQFDRKCRDGFGAALDALGPAHLPLPALAATPTWAAERSAAESLVAPLLADEEAFPRETSPEAAATTAQNAIALTLLLDQMPRNVFRDRAAAVAYSHYDRLARAVTHHFLGRGTAGRPDQEAGVRHRPGLRMWLYMPLMHSEWQEDHRLLLELARELQEDSAAEDDKDGSARQYADKFAHFVGAHEEIVRRFGRFPHRNDALDRESTEEELKYLRKGGETFGTKSEDKGDRDSKDGSGL